MTREAQAKSGILHRWEILRIGQAIFSQKGEANSLHYFVNTTFNSRPWQRLTGSRR